MAYFRYNKKITKIPNCASFFHTKITVKKILAGSIFLVFFGLRIQDVFALEQIIVESDVVAGRPQNTFIIDQDDSGGDRKLQFGTSLDEYLIWDNTNNYFSFSDDINLGGNQLINARIENTTPAPTCNAGAAGRIYYDTASFNSFICNGNTSSWEQIDAAGGSADWDTIGDPSSAATIDFTTFTQTIDLGVTDTGGPKNGVVFDVTGLGNGSTDVTALKITTTTNDDANYIPMEVRDDSGAGNDLLFQIDSTGALQTPGAQDQTFIIDTDDTGGDLTLQFGTTLSETLRWDNTNTRFTFTDGVRIEGNAAVVGQGYIAADHSASDSDGVLNLGLNAGTWETFTFDATTDDRFELSDDLEIQGNIDIKSNQLLKARIENATSITCDAANKGRLYIDTDGGNLSYVCDGSTLQQIDRGATAWDDISDADATATINFGAYPQTLTTAASDAGDKNALTLDLTGVTGSGFGDVTALAITSSSNDASQYIPVQIFDDSGGTPDLLFKVDYTGKISTDGGLEYLTNGRPTRQITLAPEFPGATFTGDGSNNSGTMTSDFCENGVHADIPDTNTSVCNTSGDIHNYYSWDQSGGNFEDYDIWIRWRVPDNFSAWAGTDPIKLWGKRTDTTNNVVVVYVFDTVGALENAGGTQVAGTNWTQTSIESSFAGTYTPGSYMTIRITMVSDTGGDTVQVGEISLAYLTNN